MTHDPFPEPIAFGYVELKNLDASQPRDTTETFAFYMMTQYEMNMAQYIKR